MEALMSVRSRMGYWLAVMLSVAAPRIAAYAQASAAGDTEWLDDCQHEGWEHSNRAHACDLRVQRLPHSEALTVDGGENGGVAIIGWIGDSVVMHALVRAWAETPDKARDLASRVTISAGGGRIRADGPDAGHHEGWSVSYRVFMPRHSDLSVETINGPMSVEGVTGHMVLKTVNGPLSLDRVGGDVHARAENGPLDVALDGARWDGTGLDAETENGPVDLSLPANYAGHLITGTENGQTDFRFPLTLQGSLDTRHLSLDIGGGGPPIRVITTNGPVTLRHTSE
jgi:hypothetical protein